MNGNVLYRLNIFSAQGSLYTAHSTFGQPDPGGPVELEDNPDEALLIDNSDGAILQDNV